MQENECKNTLRQLCEPVNVYLPNLCIKNKTSQNYKCNS